MVKKIILLTLAVLAVTMMVIPASASLIPMSWGFPVMVQNHSLTGINSATQQTSNMQAANVAFGGSGGGLFGSAFPTMSQLSNQNGMLTSFGFANENQNALFAYPYISIGGSPVPGMGLF